MEHEAAKVSYYSQLPNEQMFFTTKQLNELGVSFYGIKKLVEAGTLIKMLNLRNYRLKNDGFYEIITLKVFNIYILSP